MNYTMTPMAEVGFLLAFSEFAMATGLFFGNRKAIAGIWAMAGAMSFAAACLGMVAP